MTKKRVKIVLISAMLAMVAVLSFALTACGSKNYKGYDVDVAKAVSKKLGIKVEFSIIDWDQKVNLLQGYNIDAVWNGMTIKKDLEEALNISQPYMVNKQTVIALKKNERATFTQADLKTEAKDFVVEQGSAAVTILEKAGATGFASAKDQMAAITINLENNSAKYAMVDRLLALDLMAANKDKYVLIDVEGVEEENFGIAFRKGNDMLQYKIEKALFELQEDGTIDKIANEYGLTAAVIKVKDPGAAPKENASWEAISKKGKIIVGITIYSPMAIEDQK